MTDTGDRAVRLAFLATCKAIAERPVNERDQLTTAMREGQVEAPMFVATGNAEDDGIAGLVPGEDYLGVSFNGRMFAAISFAALAAALAAEDLEGGD